MGTFKTKRGRAWCTTLSVLLVMTGAALGQYDEPLRILDEDVVYQENTNPDPRRADTIEGYLLDSDANKAIILDKIMQGVQMRSEEPGQNHKTISETIDYLDLTRKVPAMIDTKDMVTKRLTDTLQQREARNGAKPTAGNRPQPKWKTKKGKGSHMICYFKLCSFRALS